MSLPTLKFLKITKRVKFLITSLLLSSGFLAMSFLENDDRFVGIGLLSLASLILFFWTLREGMGKNATLYVLILPALFTLGVGLFWFLLPSTLAATLPFIFLYGVGIYALCLTMNIFTVSTIRTIALSRAAKGVGFVLTLFTVFLLYDAVYSLRSGLFIRAPIIFIASFPLFLQGLWSSQLEHTIDKRLFIYSGAFSLGVVSVSVLLFFWPVSVVAGSLFLTVVVYVLLGLGQSKIEGRLFQATVREYLIVGIVVFALMMLTTSWR